jgi:hypothetical protein
VLNAVQIQHGVPTVRTSPQLALIQVADVQADVRVCRDVWRRPYRDDRRQNLRGPENRLFKEGSIGVSCEKPTPNVAGMRRLYFGLIEPSDDLVGTRGCGASIPTRSRSFPLFRCGRSRCRLTTSS